MNSIGVAIFALGLAAGVAGEAKHNVVPKNGYVPTAEAAIKIAVAVWEPIYGAERIAGQKPFKARLEKGVWTVTGTLPAEYTVGGVAIAEISKEDGRVLRVSHGK